MASSAAAASLLPVIARSVRGWNDLLFEDTEVEGLRREEKLRRSKRVGWQVAKGKPRLRRRTFSGMCDNVKCFDCPWFKEMVGTSGFLRLIRPWLAIWNCYQSLLQFLQERRTDFPFFDLESIVPNRTRSEPSRNDTT